MALLDDWAGPRSSVTANGVHAGGVPCSRYYSVSEAMAAPPVVGVACCRPFATARARSR